MRRAIITVGLGFGDEGKGAWVDKIVRDYGADLVVRYSGGSQCGHNVQLPNGHRHTFSQFGAGSFAGAGTYLGPQVIINPPALLREFLVLKANGSSNAANELLIHPKCLVSTKAHQYLNKIKELARANGRQLRHGSCGHGIGETRNYWLRHGEEAIFAGDLDKPRVLAAKLELLRQRILAEIDALSIPDEDFKEYNLSTHSVVREVASLGQIANQCISISWEMPKADTVVFEGAQGVLLDEYYGFHPHTTWSTVTPHHALELAEEYGAVERCVLGLTRTYTTRHGAGPLPTYSEHMTERLPDPGNPINKWQGSFQCGDLDLVLLNYAAKCCGKLDGVLVSHLDQIDDNAYCCKSYEARDGTHTTIEFKAKPSLERQAALGQLLRQAVPTTYVTTKTELLELIAETTGTSVVGTASGPTHEHRDLKQLQFR